MDNANVPTAPRYKTPTPDQINSTQPIPDHIVSIVIFLIVDSLESIK